MLSIYLLGPLNLSPRVKNVPSAQNHSQVSYSGIDVSVFACLRLNPIAHLSLAYQTSSTVHSVSSNIDSRGESSSNARSTAQRLRRERERIERNANTGNNSEQHSSKFALPFSIHNICGSSVRCSFERPVVHPSINSISKLWPSRTGSGLSG